MSDDARGRMTETQRGLAKRLDALGWGLFFIWIGVAVLASVGWGAGLLGVGAVMLGAQLARKHLTLPVERFAVVVGALLFFGGAWQLLGFQLGRAALAGSLLPVVCIVAGASLLVSALRRRPVAP